MDLKIDGKTALVTGASRGLGAAISKSLASENVKIIACARNEQDLNKLMKELPNSNPHDYFVADLSRNSEIKRLLNFLKNKQIDILINNVGGTLNVNDPFQDVVDFQNVMKFNLEISIQLNNSLIPKMQQNKWGRVCHISSISALENQGPPAYCAAKAALNAYVRSIGRFVAADNVIVTGVMPGAVLTKGGYWDEASIKRPDHVKKYLDERMAIKRFGLETEISELVSFMVSEHASFLVGSIFLADGGQGRVFQNLDIQ